MPKTDIPIETLITDLHGANWERRCDAARLLGQSRDPRAVDALLPDLNDADWRVRRNAVQALGALKDKRALDHLMTALKDKIATVRERAAVALGRLKDPLAIPSLIEALFEVQKSGVHINEGVYQAIRKFGSMFADAREGRAERVKTLIALLKSASPLARAAAALSLAWYIDAQALGPLAEAGKDTDETVQRASAWARAALETALRNQQSLRGQG